MFDIVMPLFNKEAFVTEAIASVVAQTHRCWNLFVVDDGSTDGSLAAVERFRDPRIKILRQGNAGPGAARNKGIAAGGAEWIAFLDADDLWLEEHLHVLDGLRTRFSGASLLGTGFHYWLGGRYPAASGEQWVTERPMRYFREVADGHIRFCTISAACSRRAIEQVGPMKPGIRVGEDTELWARLALHGPVVISTRRTALYRVATGGITDSNASSKQPIKPASSLHDVGPAVETVGEYIGQIADHELRQDVLDYIDAEVGAALFRSLRKGQIVHARSLIQLFPGRPRGKARLAARLARLPPPLGERILTLILWTKRAIRTGL